MLRIWSNRKNGRGEHTDMEVKRGQNLTCEGQFCEFLKNSKNRGYRTPRTTLIPKKNGTRFNKAKMKMSISDDFEKNKSAGF